MASLVTDPAEADVSIIQMSCFPGLLGYKEPGEGHGVVLCEMWGNNVSSGKHVTFRLIYHHVRVTLMEVGLLFSEAALLYLTLISVAHILPTTSHHNILIKLNISKIPTKMY